MHYHCQQCNKTYAIEQMAYRCTCGGLFSLAFADKPIDFTALRRSTEISLWRYRDSLPFISGEERSITMGEGFTPLIELGKKLWAKCDYYMPTLSFKDRGAVMLITMAKQLGVDRVVCDSSGNAGTAISAYAARAGIDCVVFVPAATSEKKLSQILAHGADLRRIEGSREDTGSAAIAYVEQQKAFYASHIFNPLFYEGTKTYFFELYEQLGEKLPDGVILPVGNGTLLLGAYRAFRQMKAWGLIDRYPTIYAVQAENCAPIHKAFTAQANTVTPVENLGTAAEGIAIAAPARGADILAAIRATDGEVITIGEDQIVGARKTLAMKGFYVETTSAVNYAAYEVLIHRDKAISDRTIVLPLCGAGIKS